METLYILVERGGSYDEKWEHHHLVSESKELLEKYIDMLKDQRIDYCNNLNILKKAYRKECDEWYVNHPDRVDTVDYPRWPAGIREQDITKEMRDERNFRKQHNEDIRLFNLTNAMAFREYWKPKMDEIIATFEPLDPEYVKSGYVDDYHDFHLTSIPEYGHFQIEHINYKKG